MKQKILCLTISFLLVFSGLPVMAGKLDVSAKAAILYDPQTKQILYEKNSNDILSMASTTKVMTALLTLEYVDSMCDEVVTITDEMVKTEGSSMGLRNGDKIALSDLVVGMLLPSGNDAANAAAIHISKSIEKFAACMNLKAGQIGMTSTNFVTPSGLDNESHYTTAYDMALLTAEALKNKKFASIFASKKLTVKYNNGKTQVAFTNHNKLLSFSENCIGGKTGFTKKSGRCLVSAAEVNGYKLISVTLSAPDDWNDHLNLYEYGFQDLEITIFEEEVLKIPDTDGNRLVVKVLKAEKSCLAEVVIERKILLPRFIYTGAYKKGDQIGSILYLINEQIIEKVPIKY